MRSKHLSFLIFNHAPTAFNININLMKKNSIFLLLCLLLFSCSRDNLCGNPNFCAELNGKKWFPRSNDFKSSPLTARLIFGDSVFAVRASSGSERIYLSIRDGSPITTKSYVLSDTLSRGYFDNSIASDEYLTDATQTGLLTIREINKAQKTVAGSFYFKARNSVTGEEVEVSNGIFNLKYVEY